MIIRISIIIIGSIILFFLGCSSNKYEQGEKLYETHCASCHQMNGEGLGKLYPPLNQSDYWKNNINSVPCIIRNGLKDTISVNGKTYNTAMAGIPQLTEYEIANIVNFIQSKWYQNQEEITIKTINSNLKNCK